MQIYEERVLDLLNPGGSDNLPIREGESGIFVQVPTSSIQL